MAMKYAGFGMKEILRSAITSLQVKELQRYVPELTEVCVLPGPSGVRAQAMGVDGMFFLFYCLFYFQVTLPGLYYILS